MRDGRLLCSCGTNISETIDFDRDRRGGTLAQRDLSLVKPVDSCAPRTASSF